MTREGHRPACVGCSAEHKECSCLMPRRRAVLLLNLGTPDSPDTRAVRRYLREFLADPFVIKLPARLRAMTPLLSAMIAQFRGPRSAELYQSIWWDEGSPLKVVTERQCARLAERLGRRWRVYYAMRYANPSIHAVLGQMKNDGITDVVVLPMYPHWAGPTTGTALERLYREMREHGLRFNLSIRTEWFDDQGYIDAQVDLLRRFAAERDLSPGNGWLLFSGHSMPVSYIQDGDPYEGQIRRSAELVRRRLGWPKDRCGLSFQSKLGPVPWLEPSTEETLNSLAERGEKNVLVCPISFTADCLETLQEIGEEYAVQFAEASHGGQLHLAPALNDDAGFMSALATLVRKGPRPLELEEAERAREPLSEEPVPVLMQRLVVAGVAVPGPMEKDALPGAVEEAQLRRLQIKRGDLCDLLRECPADNAIDGCFAVNTCQRYEVYALAAPDADQSHAASVIRQRFFGEADVEPLVLHGADAYRRLLRTATGLNSVLPGDADVLEQIRSARRAAQQADALSQGISRLLKDVDEVSSAVRERTGWGRHMVDFAAASMERLGLHFDPSTMDGLIVGGSTTSRQLLRFFAREYPRIGQSLTFAYRGEGRRDLVRFIRQTAPHIRRLRVGRYNGPETLKAIAHADMVFLGVDARDPLFDAEAIAGLRDFSQRPLIMVDFNSFGSTRGVDEIEGVRVVNARKLGQAAVSYAQAKAQDPDFQAGFEEAGRCIESAVCGAEWDPERAECANGPCGECTQEDRDASPSNAAEGAYPCIN